MPETHQPVVTQPVTKVATKAPSVTKAAVCQAEGCGVVLEPKFGRPPAYCSTACRMRAFRALKRKVVGR